MNKTKLILFVLLLGLCVIQPVVAQDVSFTLSVDRNIVRMDQQLNLEIEVRNTPRFPEVDLDLSAFDIIGGPAQSSSYQWINGRASTSRTLIYTLVPLRPGQHTIGPLVMQYNGEQYTSNSVTITVTNSQSGSSSPGTALQSPGSEDGQDSEVVFIRAIPSKTDVFVGEQINVSYKIYTRVSLRNYSIDKQPDAIGFWKEVVDTPQNPRLSQEIVNGIRYNTAVIQDMAYFPTKSGELSIEALPVTVEVQADRDGGSMFNDFFSRSFGRVSTRRLVGDPITIESRPVPSANRPESYNGAVGDFTMTSSLDATNVQVDEAVSLTITIRGTGNIPMVTIPQVTSPDGADLFEPEIETDYRFRNAALQGNITYQYIIIPREAGTLQLPAIRFSYFDPGTETFHELSTDQQSITVNPVAQPDGIAGSGFSRDEVTLLNRDIRYLKSEPGLLRNTDTRYYSHWGFYVLLLLSMSVIGGTVGYQYWYEHWGKDVTYLRRRNASKRASEYLQEAKQHRNDASYYGLLSKSVLGFIGDKCDIAENALNMEELREFLETQQVPDSTIKEITDFLLRCDAGRFSPDAATGQNGLDAQAKNLIKELDKYL